VPPALKKRLDEVRATLKPEPRAPLPDFPGSQRAATEFVVVSLSSAHTA